MIVPQFHKLVRLFNANAVDRVFAAEPNDVIVAAGPCCNQSHYFKQGFDDLAELTAASSAAALGVVLSCSACTSARQMEYTINELLDSGTSCLS